MNKQLTNTTVQQFDSNTCTHMQYMHDENQCECTIHGCCFGKCKDYKVYTEYKQYNVYNFDESDETDFAPLYDTITDEDLPF